MAKIGIYTYFPPYIGGGERYIMTFANALQYEHDVSFLCPDVIKYKKLAKTLDIELPQVKFVEFQGISNLKKHIFNIWIKKKPPEFDLFVAMANHTFPPVIGLGRKNILHIQFPYPYPKRDIINPKKFIQRLIEKSSYCLSVVNSEFTKGHVKKRSNYPVEVIYPPVEIENLKYTPYQQKKNQIISVGRFLGTQDSKRQLEMVQLFKKMYDLNPDLDIRYVCVGGERPEKAQQKYLNRVKEESKNYPISIITNISSFELVRLYSESKIFWHGKGYLAGQNYPEYTEHFGISTVEAMASGCIPVAYRGGGQIEIIKNGFNGYLWKTGDELIEKTLSLLTNPNNSLEMSKNAYEKSVAFSSERFKLEVKEIVAKNLSL
jgi:glycosyltransferase involved in cell wall biosynthesis